MAAVKIGVEVQGVKRLNRIARVLSEKDLPFLDEALREAGDTLAAAIRSRAPSGTGRHVDRGAIKGSGAGRRIEVNVEHVAGKSFEFGKQYGHHFVGNNSPGQKRKKRTKAAKKAARFHLGRGRGFKAEPYVGVLAHYGKGRPGALQAVDEKVQQILADGIEREITRLAEGPDS